MTDTNDPPQDEPRASTPDWDNLREMIRGAFTEGKSAGTEAGRGSADKVHDIFEKALYDATYGIAYGVAYAATMAKEAVVRPASSAADDGARAGREAAARDQADADAANPDSTPGFSMG